MGLRGLTLENNWFFVIIGRARLKCRKMTVMCVCFFWNFFLKNFFIIIIIGYSCPALLFASLAPMSKRYKNNEECDVFWMVQMKTCLKDNSFRSISRKAKSEKNRKSFVWSSSSSSCLWFVFFRIYLQHFGCWSQSAHLPRKKEVKHKQTSQAKVVQTAPNNNDT